VTIKRYYKIDTWNVESVDDIDGHRPDQAEELIETFAELFKVFSLKRKTS
jgi:hypothetical protein